MCLLGCKDMVCMVVCVCVERGGVHDMIAGQCCGLCFAGHTDRVLNAHVIVGVYKGIHRWGRADRLASEVRRWIQVCCIGLFM